MVVAIKSRPSRSAVPANDDPWLTPSDAKLLALVRRHRKHGLPFPNRDDVKAEMGWSADTHVALGFRMLAAHGLVHAWRGRGPGMRPRMRWMFGYIEDTKKGDAS